MKIQILILAGVLAMSGTAHALDLAGVPLIVSGDLSAGYSSTSVATGYKAPTILMYGVGATVAYKFYGPLFAGVSPGFQYGAQLSETGATGSGSNYRGSRFYLNTTVGADVTENIRVSADFEFLGNWSLYAKNAAGQSTSFAGPLGAKIKATHKLPWLDGRLSGGLQGEYLTFSKMNREGTTALDLTTKQKLWSAGLIVQANF